MNRNNLKKTDSFDHRETYRRKSTSRFGVQDELKRKFQLSSNEIDELRNSLYYVETRLEKEMDVKNELVEK